MNDVKSIYLKLNALNTSLLSQAANPSAIITDGSWNDFNGLLDMLASLTQDNHYTTLRVNPSMHGRGTSVLASNFSSKVYQAANYLFETNKSTQLSDQYAPDSPKTDNGNGMTQTSVLTQAQDNTQSQAIEVNVEFNQTLTYITEVIVEAKDKYPEGTKERAFLDKLKEGISTAKSTADLIKMIVSLAAQFGVAIKELGEMFK